MKKSTIKKLWNVNISWGLASAAANLFWFFFWMLLDTINFRIIESETFGEFARLNIAVAVALGLTVTPIVFYVENHINNLKKEKGL